MPLYCCSACALRTPSSLMLRFFSLSLRVILGLLAIDQGGGGPREPIGGSDAISGRRLGEVMALGHVEREELDNAHVEHASRGCRRGVPRHATYAAVARRPDPCAALASVRLRRTSVRVRRASRVTRRGVRARSTCRGSWRRGRGAPTPRRSPGPSRSRRRDPCDPRAPATDARGGGCGPGRIRAVRPCLALPGPWRAARDAARGPMCGLCAAPRSFSYVSAERVK